MPFFLYFPEKEAAPKEYTVQQKLAYYAAIDEDEKAVADLVIEFLIQATELNTATSLSCEPCCPQCEKVAMGEVALLHLLPAKWQKLMREKMIERGYEEAVRSLPNGPLPVAR
jgi:hypothetical protein